MKIIMNLIKRVTDSCKEIFGLSHHSIFTWKNRTADHALSLSHRCSTLGCILTLNVKGNCRDRRTDTSDAWCSRQASSSDQSSTVHVLGNSKARSLFSRAIVTACNHDKLTTTYQFCSRELPVSPCRLSWNWTSPLNSTGQLDSSQPDGMSVWTSLACLEKNVLLVKFSVHKPLLIGATISSHILPPLLQDLWPCVQSAMLHARETWPLIKTKLQHLRCNDRAMIREICIIKPEDVATVRSRDMLSINYSGAVRTACD